MTTEEERLEELFSHCQGKLASMEESYALLRGLGYGSEEARGALLAGKKKIPFPPITFLEFFLLDACNLACSYCFVKGMTHRRRMSLETAKKAFGFLLEQSGGIREIGMLLMGGEPMLAFPLLKEFLPWVRRQSKGRELRIDMTSNGTLLQEESARFLAKHGVKVLLSLDGEGETHDLFRKTKNGKGSFEQCLRAVDLLKKHQGFVGAKITTMPQTAGSLEEDLRKLYERGVGFFILGHATGVPWSSHEMDTYTSQVQRLFSWWRSRPKEQRPRIPFFEKEMGEKKNPRSRHRWGCRAGRRGIAVDPVGDFYPCSKMISGTGGNLYLGNLDSGITEIRLREQLCGMRPFDRDTCWNCFFQSKCSGGCYAVNMDETGSPFRPGNECRMIGRLSLLARSFAP